MWGVGTLVNPGISLMQLLSFAQTSTETTRRRGPSPWTVSGGRLTLSSSRTHGSYHQLEDPGGAEGDGGPGQVAVGPQQETSLLRNTPHLC